MNKDTPRPKQLGAANRDARRAHKEPYLTQFASFVELFVWLLVLKSFLSPTGTRKLLDEALQRRQHAYFSSTGTANVYFSSDDPSLPEQHPRRVFLERTNGFITSDNFGPETCSRLLYYWPPLTRFIADCLGKRELFIYDDPVSNMIVNVGRPGTRFNWHFDTNEFTITMLLQPASSGGHFEYVPDLRSVSDENYDGVRRVLEGDTTLIRRLALEPGDLQLFLGRFSLHRVTEKLHLDVEQKQAKDDEEGFLAIAPHRTDRPHGPC